MDDQDPYEVKQRFEANEEEISKYLNFGELVPLLCEGAALLNIQEGKSLLNPHKTGKDRTKMLHQMMDERGLQSYTTFLACIRKEERHHGHCYVRDILEGKQHKHASANGRTNSTMIRNIMIRNLTVFSQFLDLTELLPHFYQCGLLTKMEYLDFSRTEIGIGIVTLCDTLDSKGPLAYNLFAKCLENERSHRGHITLYHMICKLSGTQTPYERTPHLLELQGSLRGEEYEMLKLTFHKYQYICEWKTLEVEASKYYTGEGVSLDLKIEVILEEAASCIFRKQKQKAIDLVSQAQKWYKQLGSDNDNSIFLEGRCEYTLSELFRYQDQQEEAREHAANAIRILSVVEPGEDTAFANYCQACALVNHESHSPKEIEAVKHFFTTAIDHAGRHKSGLNLVEPHALMKLAQAYLGSTQYRAGNVTDMESISKAENCLKKINRYGLHNRSRCHFHLVESDLYRSKGQLSEAKRAAQSALDLAKAHDLCIEKASAEKRLQAFQDPQGHMHMLVLIVFILLAAFISFVLSLAILAHS